MADLHGVWTHNAICQLTIIGTCDTSQIVNVHHFEAAETKDTSFTSDASAVTWSGDVADYWITTLKSLYLAMHTNDYLLNMVKAQVLERGGQINHKLTSVERPQTTGNAGTQSAGADMHQTAVNLKWRTPVAGKRHRGRTYIGPLQAQTAVNGRLGTGLGFHDSYQNYVTAMIANWNATSGTRVTLNEFLTIYSRPYNKGEYQYPTRKGGTYHIAIPEAYDGDSTGVTNGEVDPILRTQRRRVVGVGS